MLLARIEAIIYKMFGLTMLLVSCSRRRRDPYQ
jgi:hypothetical protein